MQNIYTQYTHTHTHTDSQTTLFFGQLLNLNAEFSKNTTRTTTTTRQQLPEFGMQLL